ATSHDRAAAPRLHAHRAPHRARARRHRWRERGHGAHEAAALLPRHRRPGRDAEPGPAGALGAAVGPARRVVAGRRHPPDVGDVDRLPRDDRHRHHLPGAGAGGHGAGPLPPAARRDHRALHELGEPAAGRRPRRDLRRDRDRLPRAAAPDPERQRQLRRHGRRRERLPGERLPRAGRERAPAPAAPREPRGRPGGDEPHAGAHPPPRTLQPRAVARRRPVVPGVPRVRRGRHHGPAGADHERPVPGARHRRHERAHFRVLRRERQRAPRDRERSGRAHRGRGARAHPRRHAGERLDARRRPPRRLRPAHRRPAQL
ncbi:MAG: hypothetical protein AVDCRST_MAG11-5, partial [uncultured Gemmatimonadaceae bacterium]